MALALLMMAILLSGAAAFPLIKNQLDDYLTMFKSFFQSLDQNSDGWVSVSESYAAFDNFDANKDGIWTMREYSSTPKLSQMPKDEARRRFNFYDKLDGKSDGKAQRSEVETFFRRTDTNGDDKLTREEVFFFFITDEIVCPPPPPPHPRIRI